MNLAELKQEVAALSSEERFDLAIYLSSLDEQSEPEYRALIDTRMKTMDAGKKVSSEDFESEHTRQSANGK